ncbi:PDR/VanB family oxidoreductase [Nonomuraea basaltis]|uniref:PDR/VanB family oxidoreductase n=1 Tax=Nonomuraea basaltis TaxID=2495887 RepID=UPI001486BB5B|nr:PDR/VanB family oxidoreductase [Nonomuraea basaltis]
MTLDMTLVVQDADLVANGIRSLRLGRPDGGPLPRYVPGSHLVVECGDGRRNAYSLTGSGTASTEYRISVLHKPDGRGGSSWMHRVPVGDTVRVTAPRSAFAPVATARRHLLIAGGIGVTPLLSHTRAAAEWGRPFTLLYGYRPGAGAHLDELRELCGTRLREFPEQAPFIGALRQELRRQPLGTHVYVCGPGGLIDAVCEMARDAGWPDERVHAERFSADDLDPGVPFTARLARSGRAVGVPTGVSLLDALEKAGIAVPNMCRQGVCGECRVGVRTGRAEHRDLFLSAAERAAGDSVMCCVSRSLDEELELDL